MQSGTIAGLPPRTAIDDSPRNKSDDAPQCPCGRTATGLDARHGRASCDHCARVRTDGGGETTDSEPFGFTDEEDRQPTLVRRLEGLRKNQPAVIKTADGDVYEPDHIEIRQHYLRCVNFASDDREDVVEIVDLSHQEVAAVVRYPTDLEEVVDDA